MWMNKQVGMPKGKQLPISKLWNAAQKYYRKQQKKSGRSVGIIRKNTPDYQNVRRIYEKMLNLYNARKQEIK